MRAQPCFTVSREQDILITNLECVRPCYVDPSNARSAAKETRQAKWRKTCLRHVHDASRTSRRRPGTKSGCAHATTSSSRRSSTRCAGPGEIGGAGRTTRATSRLATPRPRPPTRGFEGGPCMPLSPPLGMRCTCGAGFRSSPTSRSCSCASTRSVARFIGIIRISRMPVRVCLLATPDCAAAL